jgi:site-specific recombinase XerD
MIIQEKNKAVNICKKCGKILEKKDMVRSKIEWRINPLSKEQIEPACIRIISGKGEKDRIVPRPKRMNAAAIEMLPLKIKRRALQNFITELARKVLNKEISFHTLRHGFGSHLASAGRPLHEIQMLMGHSSISTTGIYLHANPKAAIEGARDVF